VRLLKAEKINEMLKQVQHDVPVQFWSSFHPEPGPEPVSGSSDFGILVLGFRI
jgi:hypothetical protein